MAQLQDFIAETRKHGFMRTARYSVIFPQNSIGSLLKLYCEEVQLPALNYNTVPNLAYGETREVPYQKLYDNITITFFVDANMKIKKFFDSWLASVQNPNTRTFNYYNSYIRNVEIKVEDLDDSSPYSVVLHECYPKAISPITMAYASRELMKLNVTFAYKYWTPSSTYYDIEPLNVNIPDLLQAEHIGSYTGVTDSVLGNVINNYVEELSTTAQTLD